MTKNEVIDKIKDEMPDFTGTDIDVEIKRALYAYITLGKMKSFDERYFFGNIFTRKKAIDEAKKDIKDIDKVAKKRKIVCITLSHLYKEVLKSLGINSFIDQDNEFDDHINNVIVLKNGKAISADLQLDLYCIHAKMRPRFFKAFGVNDVLPQEKLDSILVEIGYINSVKAYRDNFIASLKERVSDLSPEEALKIIMESKETYDGMEGIETSEAYKYYAALINEVFDKNNAKKILQFSCARTDESGNEIDYTFCIFPDTGDYRTVTPYIYSVKNGRMLSCDFETLQKLENEGLKLGNFRTKRRVVKLKKYISENERAKEKEETAR